MAVEGSYLRDQRQIRRCAVRVALVHPVGLRRELPSLDRARRLGERRGRRRSTIRTSAAAGRGARSALLLRRSLHTMSGSVAGGGPLGERAALS